MSGCPNCAVLQAALELEVSRRTTGGSPLKPIEGWANMALPPPPSASDDTAPAHRRVGLVRSDEHLRGSGT